MKDSAQSDEGAVHGESDVSYQALLDENHALLDENHSLQSELQHLKARLKEVEGLRHAEEELRESKDKYGTFFENSSDAILLALVDGTVYKANPAACRIFGMTEEEIIQTGRNGLLDTLDPRLELALEEVGRTGRFKGELNHRRKDGTIFPGEISTETFKDKNNSLKVFIIIRDIAEHKLSEDTLRKTEVRYRTLFTNMTDAFILAEIIYNKDSKPYDYRFLEVNPAFELNTGMKREQILGRTVLEVFPNANRKILEKCLKIDLTDKSKYFEFFSQTLRKHLDVYVFSPEKGKIAVIFKDITERKQIEEKTRQRAEEIETVMEVVPAAIWIGHDPQCHNITGNQMANELYEAKTGENVSANITPVRHYFHKGRELAADELPMQKATLKDVDVRNEELDVLLPSGEWVAILGSASPLHDINGNVRGGVAAFMDITQRKKVEVKLKETLDNLEELVKQRTGELEKAYNSLKESERGLTEAQKMAHIGSWDWNFLTDKIYWSDEMYRIFGLKPQEFDISFDKVLNYVHPGDRDYLINAHKRSLKGEISGNLIEFRIISANGEEKVIHGLTEVIFNEENKPVRIKGIDQDITSRKKNEEALRASEERYRSLYENSLDGILLTKSDGTILSANTTACNLFGMTEDEVIKAGREGLVVKDERLKATLEERELKGQAKTELTHRRKDGSIFVGEVSSGLFTDIDGSIKTSIIVRDVTKRKKAEEALRESEERFRTVIENSRDGINMLDLKTGRYVLMSPAHVEMTGFTAEEINNISAEEVYKRVHPEDRNISIAQQKLVAAGIDTPSTVEYRWKVKSGEYRWFSDSRKLVRDSRGNPVALVGISRDITDSKQAEEKIRNLANVVESSNDAIITKSLDGRITSWNKGAEQIYGYLAEETLGKDISILEPEDLKGEIKQLSDRVKQGQKILHYETLRLKKDGTKINVSVALSPVFDLPGRLAAISVIARDITERKKAEEALRDSEARLKAYLENSAVIAWMKDEEGYYTFMSNNYEKLFGVHFENWCGKTDFEIWPREIAEKFHENDLAVLKSGKHIEFVEETRRPDGNTSWWLNSKFPFVDSSGKKHVGGLGVDITELKKAEEALRESEERFNLAVKAAQEGVWDWNMETNEVWYSPRYKEMLGYSEDEIEHHISAWLRLLHPDDKKQSLKIVDAVMRGERNYELEFRLRHKDGHYLNILSRGYPIRRESDGKIVRIVGTHFDLTDRQKAEESLRKSKEQYQTLFNSISEGFANYKAIYDEHGTLCDLLVLEINPAGARLSGVEREAQIGKTWREVWPDMEENLFETYLKVDQTGKSIQFESFSNITGRWYFTQIDRIKKGQFAVIFKDITEKKEAQETLAKIETARKKEIHHRIKNNLQVISSLLDLAAEKFKNKNKLESVEVLEAFRESQNRIMSIAFIHKELHDGGGINTLNFSLYLQKLAENLFQTYRVGHSGINLDLDLEDNVFYDTDIAVPLGMIVNELISNSFKYAFPDRNEGTIRVKLFSDKTGNESDNKRELTGRGTRYTLIVSDNGIGIAENIDLENSSTLGLQLVAILVDQLDGEIELKRDNGTEFVIGFNLEEKRNE